MSDANPREPSSGGAHDSMIDAARREAQAAAVRSPAPTKLRDVFRGYRVLGELRRGGQGTVFHAVQESTGREVAIKVMHGSPLTHAGPRARFEREVRVLSRLRHPNIVTIYDSGVADGQAYFIMDFIHGTPLDHWIDAQAGRAAARDAIELIATIAEAISAAHLLGIIHRDVKPGNIVIDAHGQPHVLDFGLAKLLEDSDVGAGGAMTQTGQFVGSLPWASPEQADGRHDGIDMRTDVYALGVLLYQTVTGVFPYDVTGGVRDIAENILNADPLRPSRVRSGLDDEIDAIALKCLQKDPRRRYQSAGELARDLRCYLAGDPIEAKRDSGLYLLRKHLRRHRAAVAIAAAFLVMLAGSSVVAWALYARAERASAHATERLWDSLVAQARAGRTSERVGRRFESLSALQRAAQIRFDHELRNEAAACSVLVDLRREHGFTVAPFASAAGLRSVDRFVQTPHPGVIEVRDVPSGAIRARFETPAYSVSSFRFSPDGRYLAARLQDGHQRHLRIWNVETGEPVIVRGPDGFAGDAAAFGPPPTEWVAFITAERSVAIHALPTGAPTGELACGPRSRYLAAHPIQPLLAVAPDEGPIAIWNLASGSQVQSLETADTVYRLSFSPNGKWLAAPSADYRVYVWHTDTWQCVHRLAGHQSSVIEAFFHAAGDVLATWAWDDTTRVWDVKRGVELFEPIEDAHVVGFDERLVLRGYDERSLTFWRYVDDTPRRLFHVDGTLGVNAAIAETRDGAYFAISGANGVRLWNVDAERVERVVHNEPAWACLFSPDGSALLAVVGQGVLRWPLKGDENARRTVGPSEWLWEEPRLNNALWFDDELLLCGRDLRRIDRATCVLTWECEGFPGMERPSLSPDGRWVFAGCWLGDAARVYEASSGAMVASFPGSSVRGAFSPDGRWLAVSDGPTYAFHRVGTWDVAYAVPRLRSDYRLAAPIAFSPDGRLAAILFARHRAQLIDAADGTPLVTLPNPEHLAAINLYFTRDGSRLVIMTTDHTIVIWDIAALRAQLAEIGLGW